MKTVMEAYKLWVRNNKEFVHSIETLATGFTWLLPERFSSSEIGPEAVYAFLGIVGAINQHIIDTTPRRWPPSNVEQKFPWPLCVSIIKDVETVIEVAAQYFVGEERKWNYLAVTEGVKAFVRLAAFRDSGFKMLLQGGEIPNTDEEQKNLVAQNGGIGIAGRPGGYPVPGYSHDYYGPIPKSLEGRAISALSRFGENAKLVSDPLWLKRIQQSSKLTEVSVEQPNFSTMWHDNGLYGRLFVTGEVLCIMRPLIYVLFVRKYGIRSWKPWLISLAVDLTGMNILSRATTHTLRSDGKYYKLSNSEKDELKRRKLIWAFYILRDPFFSAYAKQQLQNTNKVMSRIPIIGSFTDKLVELILGAQSRFTYTSGS